MDDIYTTIEQAASTPTKEDSFVADGEFDKEAWAAKKQSEREVAFAMIEQATERVSASPEVFKEFLDTMARFPNYSESNTLLIFEQNPEATRVADYEAWKRMGEGVKRGESGITILEPGDEYTREDGSIGVSYNTKKVFDVAQTTSRQRITRQPDERSLIKALVANSPVPVQAVDTLEGGTNAVYSKDNNTIAVARGLDGAEIFRALSVELSHIYLADNDSFYDRVANDRCARASAYVVCRRFGIEPHGLEPKETLRTGEQSLQEVREEIGSIRGVSKDITKQMNKTLDANKSRTNERGGCDGR
jgi:hypothetical protein